MKRFFFLSIFSFVFFSASFSQTDKGWRSVGGTGNVTTDFKNNRYGFNLNPEMYWFVANSFALGTDFGFGFASSSSKTDSIKIKYSSVFAYVAPGFRFYFRDPATYHWRPYVFLNAGYETSASHSSINSTKSNTSQNGFKGYAGVGEAWFFSDHAAFDMRLHVVDFSFGNAIFSPSIYIGIQAFFHHE
jgi:hypothetical protein